MRKRRTGRTSAASRYTCPLWKGEMGECKIMTVYNIVFLKVYDYFYYNENLLYCQIQE
jgi:hypothetical protein